jgi:thioredoxin reductase
VHYHLADARSFAGRRVVVVGLGDVAMEAAVALAAQPETTVTLVARGDGFRRGKQRNVDAVQRAVAAGRVQLKWRSQVAAVTAAAIELDVEGDNDEPDAGAQLPWDALFVMVGAIAPWDFLQKAGVERAGSGAEPDAVARPHLPVIQ